MDTSPRPAAGRTIILMGVSGSGKTTVGMALANELGTDYIDADSLHSQENRATIASGVPLTDQDREPWLARIGTIMIETQPRGLVLACSALKEQYRDALRDASPEAAFVYLRGGADLIAERLQSRTGHFAPPEILESQMATLEEPDHALTVDIEDSVATIVRTIREGLGL